MFYRLPGSLPGLGCSIKRGAFGLCIFLRTNHSLYSYTSEMNYIIPTSHDYLKSRREVGSNKDHRSRLYRRIEVQASVYEE